jgi:hypothetical protein
MLFAATAHDWRACTPAGTAFRFCKCAMYTTAHLSLLEGVCKQVQNDVVAQLIVAQLL